MLLEKFRQFLDRLKWQQPIWFKVPFFLAMIRWQKKDKIKNPQYYRPHGIIIFDGIYGSGKTVSMIWYVKTLMREHPKMNIYANFDFPGQKGALTKIDDFEKIEDEDGSIFLIDEAQKSFDARKWSEFDLGFAAQLAENRKMAKLFLVASQNFKHVDVRIRDLAMYIVECKSFMGLLFRNRFYTPSEYEKRASGIWDKRPKTVKSYSFVGFPELFNSFASLKRLGRIEKA